MYASASKKCIYFGKKRSYSNQILETPLFKFQEGKEQALYFDAHVLDAQRRRHDVRGCRCRFLVRYDHDQSEVYNCLYSLSLWLQFIFFQ
jgi:hypothetical protein